MSKRELLKDDTNYSLEYYNSVRSHRNVDTDDVDFDLLEAQEAELDEALESIGLEIEIC